MLKFIDLAFILIIIPWRMIPLAKSRGLSPMAWTLVAIGAWIATSLVVAITYAFVQSFGALNLGWSVDTLRKGMLLARLIGILCSFMVYELLRRRLVSKPFASPSLPPPPNGELS